MKDDMFDYLKAPIKSFIFGK